MKYLVLGASASGLNGAREIRTLDRNGDITLVSIDDKVNRHQSNIAVSI